MALFRLHKGSIHESLQSTKIVSTIDDIYKIVNHVRSDKISDIKIEKCTLFDSRIGWYTTIVTGKRDDDIREIIGFLSEPLDTTEIYEFSNGE